MRKEANFKNRQILQLCFLLVGPVLIAVISLALWLCIGKYIDVGGYPDNFVSRYEWVFQNSARASNTRIGGIAYVTRDLILDVLNAHAAQLPQRD